MGRKRLYKCRHCGHETEEKADNWQHIRTHLEPDKLLACDSCQFVTQFKHHLEYHERTHSGFKPFKCDLCDYQCVNKYMLNSHLKSHSSVYPYQCSDCKYAAKYLHSLKMHLTRRNHQASSLSIEADQRSQGGTRSSSTISPQSSSSAHEDCILDLSLTSKHLLG